MGVSWPRRTRVRRRKRCPPAPAKYAQHQSTDAVLPAGDPAMMHGIINLPMAFALTACRRARRLRGLRLVGAVALAGLGLAGSLRGAPAVPNSDCLDCHEAEP